MSGVVFSVKDSSVKRELADKSIYFCCNGCAEYFDKNTARVTEARNLSPISQAQ